MAIRERVWDCPSCGETDIKGRYKECPNCGKDRGSTPTRSVQGAAAVTDPEMIAQAKAGPDWNCQHCQATNRGDKDECFSCGAARGTSPTNNVVDHYNDGRTVVHEHRYPVNTAAPSTFSFTQNWNEEAPRFKNRLPNMDPRSIAWGLALILVFMCVCGGAYLLLRTHEVNATVSGFEWSRTIHIDAYKTVRDGGWSVPYGGRQVSTEQRVHHYDSVFSHYENDTEEYACGSEDYVCGSRDLGNGYEEDIECSRTLYCERQVQRAVYKDVPVYQTWYTYDIERWVPSRTVPTSGTNRTDPAPYWGEVNLNCANSPQIGCERENRRDDDYIVFFTDSEGEIHEYSEDSYEDWLLYESGRNYILKVNSFGIQNDPLREKSE